MPEIPASTAHLPTDPSQPERIGIIDLGTNTFHLLIIDLVAHSNPVVREKFKQPVKLGEGGITSGKIAPEAFARGLEALKKFRTLMDARGVGAVYAYATSAIRSAANGAEFVERARAEANIPIRIINGNEEAALIYLGVKNGIKLPIGTDSLLVDIGGGSVEFIVADPAVPKLIRSIDVGAARLLELVQPSDPITETEIAHAQDLITERLAGLLQELKDFELPVLVGSSGTFESLGMMIAAQQEGDRASLKHLNGFRFPVARFWEVHHELLRRTRAQRLEMKGMEEVRVDMIVLGSLLVARLITELDIREIMVSAHALKDGILAKHQKDRRVHIQTDEQRHEREREVVELARKFAAPLEHTRQVSRLALSLFDQLADPFNLEPYGRELLHYAALLYPIGLYIGRRGYHKNSQYIINNCGLAGFSSNELLLLSNLVRYHRKSLPQREHMHYNVLMPAQRELIQQLAGILRIAIALDRSHRSSARSLTLELDNDRATIVIAAQTDLTVEIESAMEDRELFEKAFGLSLKLRRA